MEKMDWGTWVGIAAIVATGVLVVLDKAGKLKGPLLLWLLVVFAVMTVPLAVGNPLISDMQGPWKLWLRALGVAIIILSYSALAIWITPKPTAPQATPAQESSATPDKPLSTPIIEASWELAGLPINIPPHNSVLIARFFPTQRVDPMTLSNVQDFTWRWPMKGKIVPPEMIRMYKITNRDTVRVYNVRTLLHWTFFDSGNQDRVALSSGKQEIRVGDLAPGEVYRMYLVNQSKYVIDVPLPVEAILQVEGSTEKRLVKIVPHGLLADIPAGFPVDDLVLPLMPSNHEWRGDRPIIKRQ